MNRVVEPGMSDLMVGGSSRTTTTVPQATGLKVPMATTNLFGDASFKDGAFTSNGPRVRAYALKKTMRAIDLGRGVGAKVYVFWGEREGVETDASKDPLAAIKRYATRGGHRP